MKRLLLFPLFAAALLAQPVLTPSGPATATAGTSITVTVSASGTASSGLTGAGWTFGLPGSIAMTGSPTSSQSAAGIFAECNNATAICIDIGFNPTSGSANINPFADGPIMAQTMQIAPTAAPGTVQISLANLLGSNGQLAIGGVFSPVTAGTAYSLKILSRCDENGDGTINTVDIQAAINAYLNKTSCPIAGDTCTPAVIQGIIVAALGGLCNV